MDIYRKYSDFTLWHNINAMDAVASTMGLAFPVQKWTRLIKTHHDFLLECAGFWRRFSTDAQIVENTCEQ